MPFISLAQSKFNGGISQNSKSGLPNSCRFSRFLDIYTDDDSVSLNPQAVKTSGSVVTGLVKWIVDAYPFTSNYRWACDDAGNLYTVSSSDEFTTETWVLYPYISMPILPNHGQGLAVYKDYLYLIGDYQVGVLGPLSTGGDHPDYDLRFNQLIDLDNTGSDYTAANVNILTTYFEFLNGSTFVYTPTKEPVISVQIDINAKGTGDWTLIYHNANNDEIGEMTVANADLPSSGTYTFLIPSPFWRPTVGAQTHFHIISTVGDGSVKGLSSLDSEGIYMQIYCQALVPDTQYHPVIIHTNGVTGTLLIGNDNYIAQYDGSTYNPAQIVIEPGYSIRGFFKDNEYVVAIATKGTTIDSFEEGKLFYWDGISPYYNYAIPVTGGTPNAVVNFKNRVLSVKGSKGDLNLGTQPILKIQPAPKLTKGKKIEVYPTAIDVWQDRAQIGYGANTDDATGLEQGVYEFGNQSDRTLSYTSVSTEVLNYGYKISTGTTQSTSMAIGCVKAFGKDLYVGWKDGSSYGVDKISKTNNPSSSGSYESLINDLGIQGNNLVSMPQKSKSAIKLVVTMQALPTGCTLTPKYKLDRADNWTSGTAVTAGATRAELLFTPGGLRYKEIEYGFDVTATMNYPIITGVVFMFDPLASEVDES